MCALCDLNLKESELKISKRIADFAKDQGGDRYGRLIDRVN